MGTSITSIEPIVRRIPIGTCRMNGCWSFWEAGAAHCATPLRGPAIPKEIAAPQGNTNGSMTGYSLRIPTQGEWPATGLSRIYHSKSILNPGATRSGSVSATYDAEGKAVSASGSMQVAHTLGGNATSPIKAGQTCAGVAERQWRYGGCHTRLYQRPNRLNKRGPDQHADVAGQQRGGGEVRSQRDRIDWDSIGLTNDQRHS
jgi:hypothetical protein